MKALFLLFLPLYILADSLHIGDTIVPIILNDQFDKSHTLGNENVWLIGWDKQTTALANAYASNHRAFLDSNKYIVYVDMSVVPLGIYSLFVKPKMKKYTHAIMQSFDEAYNKTLPYKEGHVTVLHVKERRVVSISFIKEIEEFEDY